VGLSNKRLKLTGAHELGKNCVALPASLFLCASTSLRHRRLRPQLKRDPLGSSVATQSCPFHYKHSVPASIVQC